MTGWRLGYSVWPQTLYEYARKLAVNSYSCVNAPTQFAGIAALTGPQDAVRAMVAEFDARRRVVVEGLNALAGRARGDAEGRLLRVPQHRGDRLEGQAARRRRCSRTPASRRSAARISASSARATSASPTPIRRENIRRALERIGDFLSRRNARGDAGASRKMTARPAGALV